MSAHTTQLIGISFTVVFLIGFAVWRILRQSYPKTTSIKADWRWTNEVRWHPIKRQGEFTMLEKQTLTVDMNTGKTKWKVCGYPWDPPPYIRVVRTTDLKA
jgi:hypothetical protein